MSQHRGLDRDSYLKEQLLAILGSRGAHASAEDALAGFPEPVRGTRPHGAPYTPWQLLEHMRIAQWDILEFIRNPEHVSPDFPEGYRPATEAPPEVDSWQKSVSAFLADLRAIEELVEDPSGNLYAGIPHTDGQTLLREVLLVADHNAYHLGQMVLMRRLTGTWAG